MTIVLELDADNCTGAKVLTIVLEQGMYTCTEVAALRDINTLTRSDTKAAC